MRTLLYVTAALIAVPAAAQDHSAHGPHPAVAAEQNPAPARQEDHSGHAGHAEQDAPTQTVPGQIHQHDSHRSADGKKPSEDAASAGAMSHDAMSHGPRDHGSMDHMDHGSAMPAPPASGPPPRAMEGPRHAADRIYSAAAMAPARDELGAMDDFRLATIMLERFEARIGEGQDLYLWDAQGWYGGDFDKLWLKSEGEGAFGGGVENAEIQALWSHAIGPWFDLQAGVRYDVEPDSRGHAVLGVQGLAPYMFEVDAAAFLSETGDLTARVEAEYDQRITQRLILQPRAELSLSAQDIRERRLGNGITSAELGLRLRYEFAREFAPYIGIGYEAKLGDTADIARAAGEETDRVSLLLGLRAWF